MNISTCFAAILLVVAVLSAPAAFAGDQALLDVLLKNGVLNRSQHRALSNKISKPKPTPQKNNWLSKVKISGSIEIEHEHVDSDQNGVEASEQSLLARLKISGQVMDGVELGLRIATGDEATSDNVSLGNNFSDFAIRLDQAYINWQPQFAPGASAILGKFARPWYSPEELVWSEDVNHEGVVLSYERQVGMVNFAATAGYLLVNDSGKDSFSADLNIHHYGLAALLELDDVEFTLGSNVFIYNNEGALPDEDDNKLGQAFEIFEVSGEVEIETGFLPIGITAQFASNASAADGEDTAWLVEVETSYQDWELEYSFRDLQKYAVYAGFSGDDFGTALRAHTVEIEYAFSEHFSIEGNYFAIQKYASEIHENLDIFQLTLIAEF